MLSTLPHKIKSHVSTERHHRQKFLGNHLAQVDLRRKLLFRSGFLDVGFEATDGPAIAAAGEVACRVHGTPAHQGQVLQAATLWPVFGDTTLSVLEVPLLTASREGKYPQNREQCFRADVNTGRASSSFTLTFKEVLMLLERN